MSAKKNSVKQSSKKKITLIIIGIAVLVVVIVLGLVFLLKPQPQINSFAECTEAGYPVQLSFPEVCSVPGGRSFTNN